MADETCVYGPANRLRQCCVPARSSSRVTTSAEPRRTLRVRPRLTSPVETGVRRRVSGPTRLGSTLALLACCATAWAELPRFFGPVPVCDSGVPIDVGEESGLLRHSVGVTETLLRLRACLAPQLSEESCVIVGLLHDVGKVGMPGKPLYLPNENEWEKKNRGIMYKYNPDVTTMGLAVRSLYIIAKYLPLSDAEAQAICYHDGPYIAENEPVAHDEEPLTLLVHWADYRTAHVFEDEWPVEEDTGYFDRAQRNSTL